MILCALAFSTYPAQSIRNAAACADNARRPFVNDWHPSCALPTGNLTQLLDELARAGCTPPIVPETAARRLFRQLLLAVDYGHRLGLTNGDIKARF